MNITVYIYALYPI